MIIEKKCYRQFNSIGLLKLVKKNKIRLHTLETELRRIDCDE
jgi:hypothetical protein